MTATVTPGRPLLPENVDERRMFDAACETMDLTPLQWIADSLITEPNMTSVAGASYWEQRTIAYNELQKAIARLAAKPADEGVRELKQRVHNLRVTLSSIVTLAESAPVNLKTQNAIAKAAKHSLDRDASTPGAPKP